MLRVWEKTAYGKSSFPEYYHVHVDGIEVGWAVWILVEASETDKIIATK